MAARELPGPTWGAKNPILIWLAPFVVGSWRGDHRTLHLERAHPSLRQLNSHAALPRPRLVAAGDGSIRGPARPIHRLLEDRSETARLAPSNRRDGGWLTST